MSQNHGGSENFDNAVESGFLAIFLQWILSQALPFAMHTVSAILSGVIVATTLFFFNRWLKKFVESKSKKIKEE